jgi:hypothetical protein
MKIRGILAVAAAPGMACMLLLSSAALRPTVSLAEVSTPPPVATAGTWQKHQYSFAFMGFTTTYSCDGLADKLKKLLLVAGARPDVKSEPGACASGFGRPDKFARADLTFYTLAPGTGDPAAAQKPVEAVWRPVAFAAHSPRELGVGDCELIEQFRNNVLPMFNTRNAVNHTTCVPHQESGSVIDLKFDSFAAAPPRKAAAIPTNSGG